MAMNRVSIKNIARISRFDLKTTRKNLIGWITAIFSVMFLYMILFNSIQDIARVEMEVMPAELLEFMGMEHMSDMGTFVGYFGMIYAIMLIAISVFSASYTAGLLYKEEKERTIEFLYSLEVSRSEIYISKAFTGLLGTILVLLSALISTIICGVINGGETFILSDILKLAFYSGFIPIVFWGFGLLLAAFTAKFRTGAGGSMLVFFTYILGYLSSLLGDKATWLSYISPFQMFRPRAMLDMGDTEITAFILYFIVIVICVICGNMIYNRRDFHV
jgi:ABC-2 type transport system permease protein